MKKRFLSVTGQLLAALFLFSCIKEQEQVSLTGGVPVEWELSFGPSSAGRVTVSTRSTLGLPQESRVSNLYVFIFDRSGRKVYGHLFDGSNYGSPDLETSADWWEVANIDGSSSPSDETRGTVHIKTLTQQGCTVVGIANINENMLDISPGQLSTIQRLQELEELEVGLNQTDIESSGYFLMTGFMKDVDIVDDRTGSTQEIAETLVLRRLNAKVQFNVQVDPDAPIKRFTPSKWQVVNLPTCSYLLERGSFSGGDEREDASQEDTDFMQTQLYNFETETPTAAYYSGSTQDRISRHGFSFYMLENRKSPLKTPRSYTDRDRQVKTGALDMGLFSSVRNGEFEYADARSTYVVVTGSILMDVDAQESVGATLSADVRYLIHLGDFGRSMADFNIFRNHNYIYNIYIRGVDDIVVEVENNYDDEPAVRFDEPEPGATGTVVISLEEIFSSDAHYASHVINFHAKNLDAENITWYVETPFNPDGGRPVVVDGAEYTEGVDYEWVEFRVNERDADGNYDRCRQVYKPRTAAFREYGTMNVTELVAYLKRQRGLYAQDQEHRDDPGYVPRSDFDHTPDAEGGPKIAVTAFVNEYYYEVHPLDNQYDPELWRSFVNKSMRYMHILSQSKVSADGESRTIGSSFTLQQRSIQSIYNVGNPDLSSAWGAEFTDDELESGATVYWKGLGYGRTTQPAEDRGNTSISNGRLNTLKEWKMLDKNGQTLSLGQEGDPKAEWATYLNLRADNETPLLRKDAEADYRYLRYSCMSRNRDNNGNGIIDPDEVRWYMGSDTQLMGLFLGAYGIEGDARLYQVPAQQREEATTNEGWRQHVIASTRYAGRNDSNLNARVVWAEEGLCGSDLSYYSRTYGSTDVYTTRCVRNLGHYVNGSGEVEDITYASPEVEPDTYLVMKRMRLDERGNGIEYQEGAYDKQVFYEFDCSRLNEASLREYVDHELVGHEENNKAACLYRKFVTSPAVWDIPVPSSVSFGGRSYNPQTIDGLNGYLDATWGILENPYCPEGYRLANVREVALIWNFRPYSDLDYVGKSQYIHSRTHWSFGGPGTETKDAPSWGWSISREKIQMTRAGSGLGTTLRCVKDIRE